MDHEIKLTELAEIGRVIVTQRPTAMAIMALSGEQQPTYFDVLLAQDVRAKLEKLGLRSRSVCTPESIRQMLLTELCCDSKVPTSTGTPATSRSTLDADVFVEAVNGGES